MASADQSSSSFPPIKHEPVWSNGVTSADLPPSPRKRQSSSQFESPGEKRLRISTQSDVLTEEDFEALARAAEACREQLADKIFSDLPQRPSPSPTVGQHEVVSEQKCRYNEAVFDAHLQMCTLSLPILENLSIRILAMLASGNYSQVIDTVTNPQSEYGQAYSDLKSLFDQTKNLYSKSSFFLYPDDFDIVIPEHRRILHNTNLVTFLAGVFGSSEVGFYDLNDNFLKIFAPDGEALGKEAGRLFIDLKTQMVVAAATSEDQDFAAPLTIQTLFPDDLQQTLIDCHPHIPLADTEINFLGLARERRHYLARMCEDSSSIQKISEEFVWSQFLLNVSDYLRQKTGPLCTPYLERYAVPRSTTLRKSHVNEDGDDRRASGDRTIQSIEVDDDDVAMQAKIAVQQLLQSMEFSNFQRSSSQTRQDSEPISQDKSQEVQEQSSPIQALPPPQGISTYHDHMMLPGGQSEPTATLYENARQIAANKANAKSNGKPGPPSLRRPWSTEEECALMTGLDQVKGPHWSQILALYGQNGSINDVLKDRNQVQLKDKARNLKLFFLKSNIEVPHYLSQVTGELKTRAPSQAAKREMEALKKLVAENQGSAQLDSIMALGNGLHDPDQDSSRTPTMSPSASSSYEYETLDKFERVDPVERREFDKLARSELAKEKERFNEMDPTQLFVAEMSDSNTVQAGTRVS